MQTQRRSMETSSEASYCERETWEDWGSRSTLSQLEEMSPAGSPRADELSALRGERDSLARALAGERARAAAAARAHDARLAELHGVIAELVRRRAAAGRAAAIPEEDGEADECESTTQPAGELEHDADRSRTDQNDTSSMLSPEDLPTPQEKVDLQELPDDTTDTSTQEVLCSSGEGPSETAAARPATEGDSCDTCVRLSERDSELCLSTARCCQSARRAGAGAGAGSAGGGSCERERGSPDAAPVYTHSPGRCESRQAKLAARVRLRRADDAGPTVHLAGDESWCSDPTAEGERAALEVCAQAGLREALVAANNDGCALSASACLWRARCARLAADRRVLRCALARAADTAHRLSTACAVQESSSVSLCCALRAADRALEAYDVLLALAETQASATPEREATELVARALLARLEAEPAPALGEPLLSPGPWLQHQHGAPGPAWSAESEARLRAHAARLKAATVTLRAQRPPPHLFSYHDSEDEETTKSAGAVSMAEMEAAVVMQEVLEAREARAAARAGAEGSDHGREHAEGHKQSSWCRQRRRRERHWLDARASETDL